VKHGKPFSRFLVLAPVKSNATADNILAVIGKAFTDIGFPEWKNYIVALGCDGASVNTGVKRGIGAQLKSEKPYILTVHCAGHRLELALKKVFKESEPFQTIKKCANNVYNFYHWYPLNWLGLQNTAGTFQPPRKVSKPPKFEGTRWIAFTLSAVSLMLAQWDVLVRHLRQAAANPIAPSRDEKAPKAAGILKSLLLPQCLVFMAHLFDILTAVTPLSLAFQFQDSTPQSNNAAIHKALKKLEKLKANGYPSANSVKAEMALNTAGIFIFKTEPLSGAGGRRAVPMEADVGALFLTQQLVADSFIDQIIASIKQRFDLTEKPVIEATKIMDLNLLPMVDEAALRAYGDVEVQVFTRHFEELLVSKGCNVYAIPNEWDEVKGFIKTKKEVNPTSQAADIWMEVLREQAFTNFNFIVTIMMCLPTTTSDCERGFSLMKRFKTALRSRLQIPFVSAMMSVKLNTPEEGEFDASANVLSWWNEKARRVCGGDRKRKALEVQSDPASDDELVSEMKYFA
jgi:hypothetical protein